MSKSPKPHNIKARQKNDLYCTNPIVVQMLLDREKFNDNVWECCNGLGHITRILQDNGYNVRKSDIINYNGDDTEIIDILTYDKPFNGDIITNPPYKLSTDIALKPLKLCGGKVAFYVSINFLASQRRKKLFDEYPPKTVYIMSKRISCAKDGDFNNANDAIDYCWVVWDKEHKGKTEIVWI